MQPLLNKPNRTHTTQLSAVEVFNFGEYQDTGIHAEVSTSVNVSLGNEEFY